MPTIASNSIDMIRKNRKASAVAALMIVFAVMNGLLLRQNLQLRKALKGSEPDRLKSGDVLEPFTAGELHGSSIDVNQIFIGNTRLTVRIVAESTIRSGIRESLRRNVSKPISSPVDEHKAFLYSGGFTGDFGCLVLSEDRLG